MRFTTASFIGFLVLCGLTQPSAATDLLRSHSFIQSNVPLRPDNPKTCNFPKIENPNDDWQNYVEPKPIFQTPKVNIALGSVEYGAQICRQHSVRLPPKFLVEFLIGSNSGFCKISLTYDGDGRVSETEIVSCTHESLVTPTLNAVNR